MAEQDLGMVIAMNNADADRAARSVYVVVALDECFVFTCSDEAQDAYAKLRPIWGGANVALCSRRIDSMPFYVPADAQDIIGIEQEM